MQTERLSTARECYDNSISRAAQIINSGGIVAIPTETVYGLAAAADNADAILKVFEAKGRPQDNPLIVHISDMEMLYKIADDVPPEALECAKRFWPGPFTMILKRGGYVAESVSAGLDTVAVRMPSDKTARDIIAASKPLAAPSANISGKPSPTAAQHVIHDLDGKIDAVVMGENCEVGLESTVVTLAVTPPRVLRPGAVTVEQLREVLPDIVIDDAVFKAPKDGSSVSSPGLKYKHYAPAADTYLVEGDINAFAEYVNGIEDRVAVCFAEDAALICGECICYGSVKDESTLAHELFKVLRRIDDMGAKRVYVHAPQKAGVGLAVYNRLIRAAGFKVVEL